jgi:hypothetical protein
MRSIKKAPAPASTARGQRERTTMQNIRSLHRCRWARPVAAHLARRSPLTIWNRTRERAAEFASRHGARAVLTPRKAAVGAQVVVTCLPTSRGRLIEQQAGVEIRG